MIRERAKRSIVWKMSDDDFKKLVRTSKSVCDICMKLSARRGGGIFTNIKRRISKMDLNTKHFIDGRVGDYSPVHVSKEDFLKRLENGITDATFLKRKIIEFSLIPYKCKECGLVDIWNNKPIKLQLEHIDGNWLNNSLNNLQFLCPNCHSQTNTFSRRKDSVKW